MEERLGRQLALTAKCLHAAFEARLSEAAGSLSTWVVLQHAVEHGELPQRLLAQHMSIEGATLVRHLDRLEREGLVARRRDQSDRRVVRVVVTPEGRHVYERLRRVADEMEGDLRAQLSEQECRTLSRALGRLRAWLDDDEGEGARAQRAG